MFRDTKKIEYHPDDAYRSVMQFIRLNKKIPDTIAAFYHSQADLNNINQLFLAFQHADLNAPIFKHPYCELYALFLLKEKNITCNDFTTLYLYIIVLMQFTDWQAIKECDKHSKQFRSIKFDTLDNLNLLNEFIENHLRHRKIKWDSEKKAEFIREVNKLSPFNKIVLMISTNPYIANNDTEAYLVDTTKKSSIFLKTHSDFYQPSVEYTLLALHHLNGGITVKPAPIFGKISLLTLHKLHQLGFHPINLYSNFILSNPPNVHDGNPGPVVSAYHDLFVHVDWGNHLTQNEYQFIFNYLLPMFEEVTGANIETIDPSNATEPIGRIYDLHLFPDEYKGPQNNFFICIDMVISDVRKAEDKIHLLAKMMEDKNLIQDTFKIDASHVMKSILTIDSINIKLSHVKL